MYIQYGSEKIKLYLIIPPKPAAGEYAVGFDTLLLAAGSFIHPANNFP
jgi:hypothetical protein